MFTDQVARLATPIPDLVTTLSIAKGLVFVAVSGGLLYLSLSKVARTNAALEAMVSERITALIASERELRKSEERLPTLLGNLPDVTWTAAQNGKTIYISPNVEGIFGFSQEEVFRGGHEIWLTRIFRDDSATVIDAFDRLFEKGEAFDVEYRIQRKDGCWIWIHGRAYNLHEDDGTWYADGILSDITQRKEAEEARHTILETALDGFYLTDLQGKILEVNDSYCRISGHSREELLTMCVQDIKRPGDGL